MSKAFIFNETREHWKTKTAQLPISRDFKHLQHWQSNATVKIEKNATVFRTVEDRDVVVIAKCP